MLRSNSGENDQMASRSGPRWRSTPANAPARTYMGKVSHSPKTTAGRATSTPPAIPARRPAITPMRIAPSKETSTAVPPGADGAARGRMRVEPGSHERPCRQGPDGGRQMGVVEVGDLVAATNPQIGRAHV